MKNEIEDREWCEACKEVRLDEKNSFKGLCLKCANELINMKIAEARRSEPVNIPQVSMSGIMVTSDWNNYNMPFITGTAFAPSLNNIPASNGQDSNRPNPPRPALQGQVAAQRSSPAVVTPEERDAQMRNSQSSTLDDLLQNFYRDRITNRTV